MKYYCKECGTVLEVGEGVNTKEFFEDGLFCYFDESHGAMGRIPDYETPEQYEKRTGKPYPDEGIVFVLENDSDAPYWNMYEYGEFYEAAGRAIVNEIIVIADPPILPPDDWRPE